MHRFFNICIFIFNEQNFFFCFDQIINIRQSGFCLAIYIMQSVYCPLCLRKVKFTGMIFILKNLFHLIHLLFFPCRFQP